VAKHDHEFVAAHPNHHIGVAYDSPQPGRHFLKQLVAGLVTLGQGS
jgi:hypothetical protein